MSSDEDPDTEGDDTDGENGREDETKSGDQPRGDGKSQPAPPESLGSEVVEQLSDLSAQELREAVLYGQELLQYRKQTTPRIEPKPGEEYVRVEDHDGYTLVVKREPCGEGCDDCPHGPYVYHVTEEKMPSGERRTHWALIGRVEE